MRSISIEAGRVIIGQQDTPQPLTFCLLSGGHALLEGLPGVGKSLIARSMAEISGLTFRHVRMTPDLEADRLVRELCVPADGGRECLYEPCFANLVLADDIEQLPPRARAVLLQAMEERTATMEGRVWTLPSPFVVIATRNLPPLHGPHPLTERERDSFLMQLTIAYPSSRDLARIVGRTTGSGSTPARQVTDVVSVRRMTDLVREVPIARHVTDYAVRLVLATHAKDPSAPPLVRQYVVAGASPRGAQALVLAAKAAALMDGRYNVAFDDLRYLLIPTLRHRLTVRSAASEAGVDPDMILQQVLRAIDEEP